MYYIASEQIFSTITTEDKDRILNEVEKLIDRLDTLQEFEIRIVKG